MASSAKKQKPAPPVAGPVGSLCRLLASLKLAVILIVALAAVLAWATFMEAARGTEYTHWYVYDSSWFIGLLGLLTINVLAAALIRFPWKKRQTGFVITHAGLLVLLVGSILTFVAGIEGQLSFEEGQTADAIFLTDYSQFSARWQAEHGQPPAAFVFRGGPVDWPDKKTLDLGELEGVALRVLKFYRHARKNVDWVEDESSRDGPALKFSVAGPHGNTIREQWLGASRFGTEMAIGPMRFVLQSAPAASMLDDFLNPPAEEMGAEGLLTMHYQGKVHRVPIQGNVGKKVPVGESGISVEIVEHLANATPGAGGRFTSTGDEPRNPLLELRVHVPGRDVPLRQIAFARHPMLNLDGVHGLNCPVKFRYFHPAISAHPGAEFLQTPDGRLYGRAAVDGKYVSQGEVNEGDRIETAGGFRVSILKYIPHARRKVTFQPIELARGETAGPEAAALVEVTAGGITEQLWFQRNDQVHARISTPKGGLALSFAYERLPLDFSIRLLDFKRGLNPGRMGNASFASSVQLVDKAQGIDEQREISMNQPLAHGKFSFYQSSYYELPDGKEASILSAAYDPGLALKYLGSLMICVGIFIMSFMKGWIIPSSISKLSTISGSV